MTSSLRQRLQPGDLNRSRDVANDRMYASFDKCLTAYLEHAIREEQETPQVVFLPPRATERYRRLAALGKTTSRATGLQIEFAYSLKSNPSDRLIAMAEKFGFLVEAISQLEAQKAISAGFEPDRVILNGPGKWWPRALVADQVRAVFCDSIEELEAARRETNHNPRGGMIGVRFRATSFGSRFGVEVDTDQEIDRLGAALRRLGGDDRFGVHFHMSPTSIGVDQWFALFRWVLDRAQLLEKACGASVACLDIGGGWSPDLFDSVLGPSLVEMAETAKTRLPALQELILEPGRGLAQPTMALLTRVLEVRYVISGREVVVDASIAEVSEARAYRHPVYVRDHRSGDWSPVWVGQDRILGRSCMESDVLITNALAPDWLAADDVMVIDQVGAYDQSKSYMFGRG
jgi:diaminopimelate decarboxylase